MDYTGRREASDIHPANPLPVETAEYMKLDPNYPQLLRWFISGMATDSFDGHAGRIAALHSIMDITRWLAHTDPIELSKILKETEVEHPQVAIGQVQEILAREDAGTFDDDPAAEEIESEGTLGSCGCVDYHMADCPLITDRFGNQDPPEPDEDDHLEMDYEDRYDDDSLEDHMSDEQLALDREVGL